MNRELALNIVLAVVGVIFIALGYPMVVFIRQDPALSMQFSLYVTLGVFLLLAIRDPSASRSVIAFTAWSSFAHAALMGTQACRNMVARGELIGVAVLAIIGVALIALWRHQSSFRSDAKDSITASSLKASLYQRDRRRGSAHC